MQTQWIPQCVCLLSKEKPDSLTFINGALRVSLPTHSSLLENHWAVSDSPCSLKQLLETLSASTQIPILQKARQRQDQIKLSDLAFSTVKSGRCPFLMVSWCHHTSKNVHSFSQANQCLSFHVLTAMFLFFQELFPVLSPGLPPYSVSNSKLHLHFPIAFCGSNSVIISSKGRSKRLFFC